MLLPSRALAALLLAMLVGAAGCSGLPSWLAGAPASSGSSPSANPAPTDDVNAADYVNASSGAIAGVLLDRGGVPLAEIAVYAADVLDGPTPDLKALGLDAARAPRAFTSAAGRFVIPHVPPGAHSLILRTPVEEIPVPPATGDPNGAILVDVKAGELTDVGTLRAQPPRGAGR